MDMSIKCRVIVLGILFALQAVSWAGEVKGVLVDESDKSPLISATVRLLAQRDSSLVEGTVSNADGKFRIGARKGKYLLEISYVGYDTQIKPVEIKSQNATADMGTIAVKANSILLEETEVVGIRAEVKVMQDTVEYNADSYKTQPNAVVQDLLKRLPGVEVDSEGKITAQGKEVSKILVDGEEFFSSDAQVASRNIPVSMIDKLQVIDRKSDLARLTGVDDGEEETVINLTVKKGMKQGWFGNVTAGYGTDDRYSGNFMINRFVDNNQFSIVGGANNINEMAFSMPGAGRFRRFGGIDGINNSQSIGFNFNVGNKEVFRAGGDLMYSHSDQRTEQKANKQYLFPDSTSYENSASNARDRSHNVVGNFRLRWQVDSLNILDFRSSFLVSFNDSEKTESSNLAAGDANRTAVNETSNVLSGDGTSYDVGGELVYNHQFKSRPGRSISTQLTYKFSNTKEDESTYSVNRFFLVPDEDEIRDQYTDNHQWTNRAGVRLTWTEPLGDIKKARFLTFAYRMDYYFNNADKLVYNIDREYSTQKAMDLLEREYGIVTNPVVANVLAEESGVLDEDQSNRFRNDQLTQSLRVGFKQNRENYRLDAGVSVNPTMMKSENLLNSAKSIPENWVWNYAPFMRFRYSFSKTSSLALDYRGNSSSPTMSQLQPVPDLSDPLRVVIGNPELLPSFRHRISVRYNNFNQERQSSIMAFGGVNVTQNSIVSRVDYDDNTGGQTTTYANVNGVWSADGMMMYTSPIGNKGWRVTNNVFARYSRTVGYTDGRLNGSGTFMVSETPSIAFRTDVVDVELRPYYNFQQTRNSIQQGSNRDVHSYGATFNANYYTPFGLSIGTDFSYGSTSGYSDGYDNDQWLWNASVTYEFLKSRQASVTLKAYDLLQQKQNISRSISANYIQDREFNAVTRYFMLSFSYRFTCFGKGTTEKDLNYDGFGPGHPRPDGPPPAGGNRRGSAPPPPPRF